MTFFGKNSLETPPKKTTKSRTGQDSEDVTLYPVALLPERSTDNRLLIHYIGYSSDYDEWREPEDLVQLQSPCLTSEEHGFHQDLALKIKSLLVGHRKSNPVSRIEMTFDKVTFDEGLRTKGHASKSVRGTQHYKISSYNDLDGLLGHNWHYRGLNDVGDFCYVVLETVEYCISGDL